MSENEGPCELGVCKPAWADEHWHCEECGFPCSRPGLCGECQTTNLAMRLGEP